MKLNTRLNSESGFSLIELMLVIGLIGLISALAFSRFLSANDTGAGERALQQINSRIQQRRDEAIRLNGLRAATSLENEVAPLVEMDLSDLSTTASLIINGTDADGDGRDDDTGETLTRLRSGNWQYSYRNDALDLPAGWSVVADDDRSLPIIGNGAGHGQGANVTRLGFDANGRTFGYVNGGWQRFPTGASPDENSAENPPFWATYVARTDSLGTKNLIAVAVAVYPSGQTEKFHFDGYVWRGWRGRVIQPSADTIITR